MDKLPKVCFFTKFVSFVKRKKKDFSTIQVLAFQYLITYILRWLIFMNIKILLIILIDNTD